MKRMYLIILIPAIIILICAGCKTPGMTSTERAKLARQNYYVDTALVERKKMLTVLRTMRTYFHNSDTINIYEYACKLNLKDSLDQKIFDSLVERQFQKLDIIKNPDTPENEFRQELMRRIEYCDTYFGKWWEDNDLRAAVVIQLGINGISYSPPVESKCQCNFKRCVRQLCEDCRISYPDRNIYIQLQRKYGDECFNKIVVSNEIAQPKGAQAGIMIQGLFETTDFFKKEITNRIEPPSYNPLPESDKALTAAWRLFRRQIGPEEYEVWSIVALPMNQFTPDTMQNLNFNIRQIIRDANSPEQEIFSEDSLPTITVQYEDEMKDGNYFASIRNALKAGKWKFVITPIEGKNKTIYFADLEIPGKTQLEGLSDILLYINQKCNYQVQIDRERFTALPLTSFKQEHTLNALVCTYGLPEKDSCFVTWYLRPVDPQYPYEKGKANKKHSDSPAWVRWHNQEFPILKFLNPDDMVLDHKKTANLPVFKLQCPLKDIPKGKYELNCIVVDPILTGVTRESSLDIKIN